MYVTVEDTFKVVQKVYLLDAVHHKFTQSQLGLDQLVVKHQYTHDQVNWTFWDEAYVHEEGILVGTATTYHCNQVSIQVFKVPVNSPAYTEQTQIVAIIVNMIFLVIIYYSYLLKERTCL